MPLSAPADSSALSADQLFDGRMMMVEKPTPLDDLPRTLDGVVRRNRDRLEVGLATAAEL